MDFFLWICLVFFLNHAASAAAPGREGYGVLSFLLVLLLLFQPLPPPPAVQNPLLSLSCTKEPWSFTDPMCRELGSSCCPSLHIFQLCCILGIEGPEMHVDWDWLGNSDTSNLISPFS